MQYIETYRHRGSLPVLARKIFAAAAAGSVYFTVTNKQRWEVVGINLLLHGRVWTRQRPRQMGKMARRRGENRTLLLLAKPKRSHGVHLIYCIL